MGTLTPGQSLRTGQTLKSNCQLHTLILQTDGNVVLYDQHSQPLWATNTGGVVNPDRFIMQADGNLVLYDVNDVPKWDSQTYGNPGAFFRIQDDGNLVVYRSGSPAETAENALWAAGCNDWAGQNAPPSPTNSMAQSILDAHNRYRAEVSVPPLSWNNGLAASAQQWANHLAATGRFQHSGGTPENLAMGTAGHYSVAQFVGMWGNEKSNFIYGAFPHVSRTENWADVGHYTQVVWRNTTEVGGAIARGRNGNDYFVCHYNPSGNVHGQTPF